ncbi:cyanobactin maturation protease PatG family protein [Streptomyces sp. NPDC002446]
MRTVVVQGKVRQQALRPEGQADPVTGVGELEGPQKFEAGAIPRHIHHCATGICQAHLLRTLAGYLRTPSGLQERMKDEPTTPEKRTRTLWGTPSERARGNLVPSRLRRPRQRGEGAEMHIRSVLQGIPPQQELLGDTEVCIAVLDGPVDLSHPCFAGADLTRLDTLVQDPAGPGPMSLHGTHVASLLFGQHGSAVEGIAPRCRGLILPVFRDAQEWRVPQLDLARAIERAVQEGAHVINISGGERTDDGRAENMLERALRLCDDNGVLVVAAVGNDGCDCLQAPAAAPSVLAVGAAGPDGKPLDSNNWGAAYSTNGILAPGQDIEGAAPGGGRMALTGSSFATPAVSGVAALLVAAQLRQGRDADPIAAGSAILETATRPPCSPGEAPECRRRLAGNLNAAGAHGLIRHQSPAVIDLDLAPVPPRPVRSTAPHAGAVTSGSGVNAAGGPSSLRIPQSVPNEGASAMDTQHADPSESADITGEQAGNPDAGPAARPPAQTIAQEAEPTSPQPEADASDAPSQLATPPEPNEGSNAMDISSAPVTASGGTVTAGEAPSTPASAAPSGPAPAGHSPVQGVRPSSDCGCGGVSPSGCQCGGNGEGSRRQLVYAIGTIGFDYQTEARRDYFRQQMPAVPGQKGDKETEGPPNIYDPRQLYAFLSKKPWLSDKLTWTLTMDATAVYALEAETPVGMDWHQPLVRSPKATPEQIATAAKTTAEDPDRLSQVLETLMYPPVSHVYRIFRDAILGQIQPTDDQNYVSRVSIPGELTGRTTRLYSGQEVPVVKVRASDSLSTWNEAALVNEVVRAVKAIHEEQSPDVAVKELDLRTTIRALLDKVYWQFRNLGQSSADRALNAAGTNAFTISASIRDGILSARHVPGSTGNFYTLDTITVAKSPFCRPGSDCQDVTLHFFDPEDDRRARVSYLYTFDVSDEPVSLAPVHQFIGS